MERLLTLVLVLAALAAAGCSDDDDSNAPSYVLAVTADPETLHVPAGESGTTTIGVYLRHGDAPMVNQLVYVWLQGGLGPHTVNTDSGGHASVPWPLQGYGRFAANAAAVPTFDGWAAQGQVWVTVMP